MHSLIGVRFICLHRLVRLTLTQPSGCLRLSLTLLSLCRCLRRVRHRLRGHRCWRRRHRQSFTNFQCERARHLFTVYSARFVRCCCCVCVCRIKCVVLEVCACVYVYLPHLPTTPPPPVPHDKFARADRVAFCDSLEFGRNSPVANIFVVVLLLRCRCSAAAVPCSLTVTVK